MELSNALPPAGGAEELLSPGEPLRVVVPPPLMSVCAECGQPVPRPTTLRFSGASVCTDCVPVFFQRVRQGTVDLAPLPYASFLSRAGARVIDWMLVTVVQGSFQSLLFHSIGPDTMDTFASSIFSAAISIGSLAAMIVYSTLMVGWCGMTLGKMACGIRVVRGDGSPVGFKRALGRALGDMISGMVLYLGYVTPLFDAHHRALHDFICDTRVVEVTP